MKTKFNWTPVFLLVAGAILGGIIRRIFLRIFRRKEQQQPTEYVAQSVPEQKVDVKEGKTPIGFQPENIAKEEESE